MLAQTPLKSRFGTLDLGALPEDRLKIRGE